MSTRTAARAGGQTIGPAEAAEETLHRRSRLERRVAIVAIVLGGNLFVDVDLDRDHRRLHVLDNVGETDRLRDLAHLIVDLSLRRACEHVEGTMRGAEAIDGDAEAGDDRGHQGELARGKYRAARLVRRKR